MPTIASVLATPFRTSPAIMGAGGGDGLLRNLDSTKTEGLSGKATAPTFPLGDSSGTLKTETCDYPSLPVPEQVVGALAWVPHVAEGNNDPANNEYLCLSGQRPDGVDVTVSNATFIIKSLVCLVDISQQSIVEPLKNRDVVLAVFHYPTKRCLTP